MKTCHQLSAQFKIEEKLQLSDFFLSRGDNILQPLLRYCQYELQREGKLSKEEIDEIVEIHQDHAEDGGDHELEKSNSMDGSPMTVSFRGHELSLDDGTVRMAFIKIQNKKEVLENLKKNKDAQADEKDSKLMELLNSYDGTIDFVEKIFQRYEGMASGPAVNKKRSEYSNLLGYCQFEKLKLVMERNENMVNALRRNDTEMVVIEKDGNRSIVQDDADAKYKLAEEIARLYDVLLQDARAATSLPGSGGEEEEIEDEFSLEANANVLRIRALRCYYVGRMYAADTVAKYSEALALFDQASKLATEAAEEIAACQDMENADELIEGMADLEQEIAAAKCRTKACAFLASRGSGASTVTSGMTLLRRLDDFDAGGKTYRLANVPPALEPIAAKPFFFDIANNYIADFPVGEIEDYVNFNKPQQRKGLLSWFNRS